mgnify:CR=1 FL=1
MSQITSVAVMVSRNTKKLRELSALFSDVCGLEIRSLDDIGFKGDIIEDGDSFEANSLIKAEAVAELGYIGIADDSGLCVEALSQNGIEVPGIHSARYAGDHIGDAANNAKLMNELSRLDNASRAAKFVCVITVAFPDGTNFFVRGECPGVILDAPRGKNGFGYDPLFYSEVLGKTFAEASDLEKSSVSHRGIAIRMLLERLPNELKSYIERNAK